jgi:cytochrome c oxidase subunit 1/cytochrome c oxidase subunit I+III
MHVAGLMGMPRRVYTYLPGLGWDIWNLLATIGSFVLAVGIFLTVLNWWRSVRHGEPAGDDPWGGETLEWSTTSPPPAYNFEHIPVVRSAEPMWDEAEAAEDPAPLADGHQTVGTSLLDAEPTQVLDMPGESSAPFLLMLFLSVFFFAFLYDAWFLMAVAAGVSLLGVAWWTWPKRTAH